MRRCLQEIVISPVKTTVPLYRRILDHELFVAGKLDTGFIERHIKLDAEPAESDGGS
jgi:biotin carboxylase